MSHEEEEPLPNFQFSPIPKEFWSFETDEPFKRCGLCGADLMEEGTIYLIEKAFRRNEPQMEYAICIDCYMDVHKSFSKKSRKLIQHYFEERVNLDERMEQMMKHCGPKPELWTAECLITGKPKAQCEEYQIAAHCIDTDLVFSGLPYMISGECMDDILKLLSDETIGILGDFSDKVLGIDQPNLIPVL